MGKSGAVALVLLLLFVIGFGRLDARKLGAVSDPNSNQDSTSSFSTPDEKTKPKDSPNTSPSNVESKNGNTKKSLESPIDKKIQDSKEKVENQVQSEKFDSKKCKENLICRDKGKTLTACVRDFVDGSENLTLLVHNEQALDLNVNITSGDKSQDLPPFGIPGHGTKEVNITYSGDKSTKVILNAGNGNCELQITQPKKTIVDTPSKSKETENTPNPKDVDDHSSSPTNPKDVIDPSTDKKADIPPEPKKVDDSKTPKDVDSPPKSPEDVNDPEKSKDAKDPPKSNDDSKSKDKNDDSKSKDKNEDSKSKDKNGDSKSKDKNEDSKSKDKNDDSKSKDDDDPSTSKDQNDPPAKHTPPINVDTHISQNNFLDQLTFYSKQITPIYGASFAFVVSLIIGASWALCSFRKRRTDNGVPYQELEMGLPESSNAVNVETAEGWDQDWDDDDWDEDKAIRSPGGNLRSISSNGLTSRATKKDDWDANWDD